MSPTMLEPADQDVEARTPLLKEVSGRMRNELHQHLTDMNELCSQVRSARDNESADDDVVRSLYEELIVTLEQHQEMISDQLSELVEDEFSDHCDSICETATCSR